MLTAKTSFFTCISNSAHPRLNSKKESEFNVEPFFLHLYNMRDEKGTRVGGRNTQITAPSISVKTGDEGLENEKKRSLCFTPHATFNKERTLTSITDLSGMFFFDIDLLKRDGIKIPLKERWEKLNNIYVSLANSPKYDELMKSIYFLKTSCTINGFHFFMRYTKKVYDDIIKEKKDMKIMVSKFKSYYSVVQKRISEVMQDFSNILIVDNACNDLSRLCVANYTPLTCLQKESPPLNYFIKESPNPYVKKDMKLTNHSLTYNYKGDIISSLKELLGVNSLADFIINFCQPEQVTVNGDEIKMRCPLPNHNDRTPSFFVKKDKDIFKCQGRCDSNMGGGFWDFIKLYYNISTFAQLKQLHGQ